MRQRTDDELLASLTRYELQMLVYLCGFTSSPVRRDDIPEEERHSALMRLDTLGLALPLPETNSTFPTLTRLGRKLAVPALDLWRSTNALEPIDLSERLTTYLWDRRTGR